MERDHDKIIRIDNEVKSLTEKIDKIISNHLPHLQGGIDKMDSRLDMVENKLAIWGGAIIVLGWLGQYLLNNIL